MEEEIELNDETIRDTKYSFIEELKKASTSNDSYTLKYMPFIMNRVRKKHIKHQGYHSYEDLLLVAISESVKAEKRYNPSKSDFSTFVRYYIDGALNEYVTPISKGQMKLYNKISKFIQEYTAKHKEQPSLETILEGTGITKLRYNNLMKDLEPTQLVNTIDEYSEDSVGVVLTSPDTVDSDLAVQDILNIIDGMEEADKNLLTEVLLKEVPITVMATKMKVSRAVAQSMFDQSRERLKDILILHDITLHN